MLKKCMLVLSAVILAACSQSLGGDSADDAILAWARDRYGGNLHEPVQIFRGDFTGDGVADALAWVFFASGGNSDMLTVALFRNEEGRMVYHRSADDVFGADPRNVVFAPGRITLTSTMPRPDDPRCCPTGSQDWVIDTQ